MSFVSHFHWDDVLFKSKSKVSLGICVPCDGLFVRLPRLIVEKIRQSTAGFFKTRPYRKACDLARPFVLG